MRVHAMLDSAAKSHGATRPDLAHEVKSGLKADFERLAQYFDEEFDRDGAHGLAVFAAGLDNIWSVLALPWKVADAARVADDFLLSPLVPLIGRGNGAIVAVVGRERGRVLALRGGRFQQIADRTRRDAGPARPGRVVAVPVPAAHRQSRPRALQDRRRGAGAGLPDARPAADHRRRGRRDARRVRGRPLVRARGGRDRVDERGRARLRRRARRDRAAVRRRVARRARERRGRALARGGRQERARLGRLGGDARGRVRRSGGAAAPSGGRASGTRTAVRPAAAPPPSRAPARSTERRWSTATTGSISRSG